MNYPSVAIVIIHWNKRELLEKFLPSVLQSGYPNLQVVLADNASTDDSVEWAKIHYPSIQIIQLPQNYGYAGGYNHALKQVKADYYILLNNDVEVTQNWIEPIIEAMENNPLMAAAQPKMLQYNQKDFFEYAGAAGGFLDHLGYVFCRGRIFESLEKDHGQYNNSVQTFWASGACLFVRAKAFHEVKGFDEDFFAHMEEVDLCWRLQLAGYQIWYIGASEVYHLGGSTLQQGNPQKTYLNFRNSLQMLLKNSPTKTLIWLIPVRSTLDLLSSIFFLMNAKPEHSWAIHRAHASFFFKFGKWWKTRKTVIRRVEPNAVKGVYSKAIIMEHFWGNKQYFSDLTKIKNLVS
jgi:GT2 family glycosyltransferase